MPNEALATTQCLVCRRVGISAADRIQLTSGQPCPTTTLPAGHVLELRYGCMRIPATSGSVRRSLVAGLCPEYRRCRHRCRYPSSWPSRYRASRYRASWATRTGRRRPWTGTPTWRWAWRWATLGHRTEAALPGKRPIQQFHTDEIPPRSRLDPRRARRPWLRHPTEPSLYAIPKDKVEREWVTPLGASRAAIRMEIALAVLRTDLAYARGDREWAMRKLPLPVGAIPSSVPRQVRPPR
jgi:hypothetical protein